MLYLRITSAEHVMWQEMIIYLGLNKEYLEQK